MTILTLRSLRLISVRHPIILNRILFRHRQGQLSFSSSLVLQKRYASSTTTSTSINSSPPHSKVNGPISTLPASLKTPDRQPGQSFFPSYAFALGKSYLTFYKDGLKAIYANFMACRPL